MTAKPKPCGRCAWTLIAVLWPAALGHAQTPPITPAPAPRDVVVVALGSDSNLNELRLMRLAGILSGEGGVSSATVRDVQLDIVSKTADFGPVLVLAPDEETRSAFHAACGAYNLCDFIATGRVRTAIVPHDTPWIRDYGPLIEADSVGKVVVTDAKYYDLREDIARNQELQRITRLRKGLVTQALVRESRDNETTTALRDHLGFLREYAEVLKEESEYGQRPQDDSAHFDVAQAALTEAVRSQKTYSVRSATINLDGGNLLKLDDGATCLTTRDIFARNRGKEADVASQLQEFYGCNTPIYLEALPGPVIEHVDMFVLPVRGKTVLLADFGLHQPHIKAAWPRMSDVERELTFQASLAMDRNDAVLRAKGFRVIHVPGLPPRTSPRGHVYYPTQLNALVRANGAGRQQLLMPVFSTASKDVQELATKAIQEAFGETTEVVQIEATVAAEAQGAVHCLTITAPLAFTVFHEAQDVRQRQIWGLREDLDDALRRVNRPALLGRWTARAPNETDFDVDLAFDETSAVFTVDGRAYTVGYSVTKEETYKWPIELLIDDGRRKARGRLDWLSNTSFRLVLEGIEPFVVIRNTAPEDVEPGGRRLSIGLDAAGSLNEEDTTDAQGSRMQAWRLDARRGQTLRVSASSTDFDAEVYVVGPDGTRLAHDDDSGDDVDALAHFTAVEDGAHRVIVKSVDAGGGGAFVVLVDDAAAAELTPIGTLEIGSPRDHELGGGATAQAAIEHAWTLGRCGTQTIAIELSSDDFDTLVRVVGSGLKEPLENDDFGDSLNSHVELACQEGASYTVIVSSAFGLETGRYRLSAVPVKR